MVVHVSFYEVSYKWMAIDAVEQDVEGGKGFGFVESKRSQLVEEGGCYDCGCGIVVVELVFVVELVAVEHVAVYDFAPVVVFGIAGVDIPLVAAASVDVESLGLVDGEDFHMVAAVVLVAVVLVAAAAAAVVVGGGDPSHHRGEVNSQNLAPL